MKRRNFITSSLLLGTGLPLGLATGVTSCSGSGNDSASAGSVAKQFTPEELGMFSFVDVAPDGKPLKAALIGNGSRGTGAACQFLEAGPNVSIVALADVFKDRQENCRRILREKYKNDIPDANCFLGFDAYKKVIAMPEVDVVLLCTPTHFRPEALSQVVGNRIQKDEFFSGPQHM